MKKLFELKKLSELTISPTPWEIIREDYNDGRVWSVEAHDGSGITEFDCNEEQFGFEEGFANAHLIAAAPDMYEALRGLLEIVCVDCKSSYEIEGKCVKCSRVVAAEKALARAAGEEVAK